MIGYLDHADYRRLSARTKLLFEVLHEAYCNDRDPAAACRRLIAARRRMMRRLRGFQKRAARTPGAREQLERRVASLRYRNRCTRELARDYGWDLREPEATAVAA